MSRTKGDVRKASYGDLGPTSIVGKVGLLNLLDTFKAPKMVSKENDTTRRLTTVKQPSGASH